MKSFTILKKSALLLLALTASSMAAPALPTQCELLATGRQVSFTELAHKLVVELPAMPKSVARRDVYNTYFEHARQGHFVKVGYETAKQLIAKEVVLFDIETRIASTRIEFSALAHDAAVVMPTEVARMLGFRGLRLDNGLTAVSSADFFAARYRSVRSYPIRVAVLPPVKARAEEAAFSASAEDQAAARTVSGAFIEPGRDRAFLEGSSRRRDPGVDVDGRRSRSDDNSPGWGGDGSIGNGEL